MLLCLNYCVVVAALPFSASLEAIVHDQECIIEEGESFLLRYDPLPSS